jgi:hypothetical protein
MAENIMLLLLPSVSEAAHYSWRSCFFVSSRSGRVMYSRNLDWILWRCQFSGTYYVFKFVCKFEGVAQQNFVFSVYLSMWWNEGNSQNYKQPFRVHISATVCSKSSQSTKFSWMLRAGYSKMCISSSFVKWGPGLFNKIFFNAASRLLKDVSLKCFTRNFQYIK